MAEYESIDMNAFNSSIIDLETLAPADLGKVIVRDGNSNPVLMFGYIATLYFSDGDKSDKRRSLNEIFFDYLKIFSHKLTHSYNFATHRMNRPLHSNTEEYFEASLKDFKSDDIYSVSATQVVEQEDLSVPTPFFILGIGNELSSKLSFVDMYFPVDWVEQNGSTKFLNIIMDCCKILRPLHGTCGLGTIFAPSTGRGSEGALAFPFLKRHPGLDYNDSIRWLIRSERHSVDCIRTINWLTIIDDARISMLGGLKRIKNQLQAGCLIHHFGGGVIIQSGDQAQLGDVNKGFIPITYKSTAQTLNPIVFKDYDFDLLDVPQQLDGRVETINWINRFNP